MVLTASTMLALGSKAPNFNLPDVKTGQNVSLDQFKDKKGLLVMFICQHCPYVKHVQNELTKLSNDYASKDMALVGISANDADKYPDDSPAELKKFSETQQFQFPFLYDESQSIAKAYTAACTPDFFLFNQNRELVYRGQLDESRPESGKPVTGKDLRGAMDAVINGQPITSNQKPSMGCNIKWKPGNEPTYFKVG